MIKKYLTCKTYLKHHGDTVVARLDTDSPDQNILHTEVGDRWSDGFGMVCQTSPDRHYLSGEIANKLYEYEQLGFEPQELREIIQHHKVIKSIEDTMHHPYLITGRRNGKSLLAARDLIEYMMNDVNATQQICEWRKHNPYIPVSLPHPDKFEIDRVIFNDPATIVFWKDGTKTVVKAENEKFDPEKGLAMAISKKALGNQGNYFETFKKWVPRKTTYREKLQEEHPDMIGTNWMGGCRGCPGQYGYGPEELLKTCIDASESNCKKCWDKVAPGEKEGNTQ